MSGQVDTLDLARFDVSPENGFLPPIEPLASFGPDAPPSLRTLDGLGRDLPELLEAGRLQEELQTLETPPRELFDTLTDRELYRLYSITGFLANAAVHGTDSPATDTTDSSATDSIDSPAADESSAADTIPACVALPLYESTSRLGCTPVLSYDAYVLHNWAGTDGHGGMTPHDVQPVTTFTAFEDERWFIAIHVAIESTAGPAIAAVGDVQQGVLDDDPVRVSRALGAMVDAVHDVTVILERMPEHNDPEVYGRGFRPYLGSLTDVRFEGVQELTGPQSFRGGSGAQSSLFQALDAALGIDHGDNPLVNHLHTLREDMPPSHRAFIEAIEAGPDLHEYAEDAGTDLREAYNDCIDRIITFRERHIDVVEKYLTSELDDTKGTGGTPYGRYLGTFIDDTRECKLPN